MCPRCGSVLIEEGVCLRCGFAVAENHIREDLPRTAVSQAAAPAGFWIRFLAWILDFVVLAVIASVVWLLGNLAAGESVTPLRLAAIGAVFNLFFRAAYYIVLHGATGQTVGKLITGVKVVALDGSEISYGVAFLRWLGYLLSNLTLLIGYILAGIRADKRALHDLVAGTRVVYVR